MMSKLGLFVEASPVKEDRRYGVQASALSKMAQVGKGFVRERAAGDHILGVSPFKEVSVSPTTASLSKGT